MEDPVAEESAEESAPPPRFRGSRIAPSPSSARLPYGGVAESRQKRVREKGRLRHRLAATAVVCVAGLACLGYVRTHNGRQATLSPGVSVATDTRRAQAPQEWLPVLEQSGLFNPAPRRAIDAAQEKSLLAAENYCARFGEYPDRANFSSGWSYSKSGLEMSLRGPVGEYDSLAGWGGGPDLASGLPEASPGILHFSISRPQLEGWLQSSVGIQLPLTDKLKSVVVDYQVGKRQGKLRFAGVAAALPQEKFPADLWGGLPSTFQRAVFRPEVLQSLWGSRWSRVAGLWTQFMLSRQDEWVGFGVDTPLEVWGARAQLGLLASGKLPAFCMFGGSNSPLSVTESRSKEHLEMSRTEGGQLMFSLGVVAPPRPVGGGPAASHKGQSENQEVKDSDVLAKGSSVLAVSERERLTVDWKARSESGELVVDFTTQPLYRTSAIPTGHPDLESQHRTKTSVVAGR